MKKMQEDEFDEIEPTTKSGEQCSHEVVKLYILGSHTDYGCVKCKMKSLILEDFKTHITKKQFT